MRTEEKACLHSVLSPQSSVLYFFSRKHLPRIEYAVGVEGALDAFHHLDGRAGERHAEVGGLDVADAVLAADGAPEFDRDGEGVADGGARAAHRLGVCAVAHEVDVDV